ncbi:hypothetical protein E2C01_099373 [Portunus trituberculatus]|uniref:Uncharacterized protein n=1 Tax=Portunus trituberculatus TaxID=210409 RepID=A0A5B7K5C3_PORTR|nr:hypothetical protein [Portunus trituberculatus]
MSRRKTAIRNNFLRNPNLWAGRRTAQAAATAFTSRPSPTTDSLPSAGHFPADHLHQASPHSTEGHAAPGTFSHGLQCSRFLAS